MKMRLTAIMMIALSVSAMAQTKKVAILETVDRDNKLTYGVRLMVRSNLAEAVATTTGYEAYDRTNLDAILDEQTFQRTGYVSDDQIRKIGEMTGVQYILVAEASKVDDAHVFVTAKILDVVTARTENISSLLLGVSPEAIQKGCQTLASKLLMVKEEHRVKVGIVDTDNTYIERVSNNEYKIGENWLTRKEYYRFINDRNRCLPAYQYFQNGLRLERAGWITFTVGGVLAISCVPILMGSLEAGFSVMAVGSGVAFAGAITWVVGVNRKNNAYQAYNQHCAEPLTLNLQYTGNGFGLALNF